MSNRKILITFLFIIALAFLAAWYRGIKVKPGLIQDQEVRITSNQKEQITSYLDELIKKGETPGLQYVLVYNKGVLLSYYNGYSDISSKQKITGETTFNGYSITKTFTALAILQLVEQSKISLDDPLTKYLASNPYGEAVTIRQLLSHTAGIPNPIPLKWIHLKEEGETFDTNQFMGEVIKQNSKLKNNPGDNYSYSNLGYLLLGQVVESVSGIPYKEYIQKNVLDRIPVDRKQLDFVVHSEQDHAKGYQSTYSFMNFLLGFMINKDKYMTGREGKWSAFKTIYVNGSAYGGLIGNAESFSKYLQQLLREDSNLISREYKRLMFTKQKLNNGKEIQEGLGWSYGNLNGREYFTKPGGGGGYYSELRIYPGQNLATVIMFNRSGMSDERFLDKVDKYFLK